MLAFPHEAEPNSYALLCRNFPAVLFRASGSGSRQTASIVLAVKDQSGAIVPYAHVQIVPSPNNIGKNQTTDTDGKLSLDVSPGSYELTVESPGFVTSSKRIEAKPGTHQAVDIVLKVGACPPGVCV